MASQSHQLEEEERNYYSVTQTPFQDLFPLCVDGIFPASVRSQAHARFPHPSEEGTGLELETAVSHHVRAGNRTLVL